MPKNALHYEKVLKIAERWAVDGYSDPCTQDPSIHHRAMWKLIGCAEDETQKHASRMHYIKTIGAKISRKKCLPKQYVFDLLIIVMIVL